MLNTTLLKNGGLVRRLTALTLLLWLGGLGCVIGCETLAAPATANAPQTSRPEQSCPMSAGRDCCHQSKAKGVEPSVERSSPPPTRNETSCCPLAAQSADPARKVRTLDAPPESAVTGVLFAPGTAIYRATIPVGLLVRDRGSTRLRCCVFLI